MELGREGGEEKGGEVRPTKRSVEGDELRGEEGVGRVTGGEDKSMDLQEGLEVEVGRGDEVVEGERIQWRRGGGADRSQEWYASFEHV